MKHLLKIIINIVSHSELIITGNMKKYPIHSVSVTSATLLSALMLVLASCNNQRTPAIRETPTSGTTRIVADESFQPVVSAELTTFMSLYTNAHITAEYKPEKDLMADFLNDSVKVIVSAWEPSDEQKKLLLNVQTVVRTTIVAHDALALVLNRSNRDSLLTFQNVQDIFTGKIRDWKQINPASKEGNIHIVFDNDRSANIRYFRERFNLPEQLAENFYAVKSNAEVIDYVSKSPGAIGIVSVNWISDRDDSLSRSFTDRIKVAAITQEYLDQSLYYMPVQGSIYDKTYPFIRDIKMVSRESFTGLGSGFISFVAGEQGQRIILKSGLVPATMPVRIIQVKNE
jgi:phosphate transport system substrate-binding protein